MSQSRPRTPTPNLGLFASFTDRFTALRKLGEGGMAEIYLARDTQTGRLVALKRILPTHVKNPDFLKMFQDEARLASAMSHPNIVRVYDSGRSSGGPFLVMEYLAGQDLFDMVRRARRAGAFLPWDLVIAIGAHAADGVAYAHALRTPSGEPLNVIHRDLTPSNIYVTWDGVVKVLDFGIARAERRLSKTEAGTVKGKAQYVAPEQIKGLPSDGRADQFSLAAVIFEVMTGRPMFDADNDLAALNAILEKERPRVVELRPDVAVSVDEVLQRATRIDPDQRYPDMQAFAEALRATLEHEVRREAIAQSLQHLFKAEFQAHAENMARLNASPTPQTLPVFLGDDAIETDSQAALTDVIEFGHPPRTQWRNWAFVGALALIGIAGGAVFRKCAAAGPAPTGSLVVRTDPPGALVTIDGQRSSWRTPIMIDSLALGRHQVRVLHPDRSPWSLEVELSADRPSITIDTTLPRLTGSLALTIQPPDARALLDSQPVALLDGGARVDQVTAGETHHLEVRMPGYVTYEAELETQPGQTVAIPVELRPDIALDGGR